MTGAPVPVTANMYFKVPIDLKLQLRRHTGTLIFTSTHLIYLMIPFLCRELKKKFLNFFFKLNDNLFSTGTATTNRLDDGIPIAHF